MCISLFIIIWGKFVQSLTTLGDSSHEEASIFHGDSGMIRRPGSIHRKVNLREEMDLRKYG